MLKGIIGKILSILSSGLLYSLLSVELLEHHANTSKTARFGHTLQACADVYRGIKKLVGVKITKPAGLPMNLIKFRLVNIFTAESKTEMKEAVFAEYCHSDIKLH